MISKICTTLLLCIAICSGTLASNIAYERITAAGIAAHVITINLADPSVRVTVALSRKGSGSSESFKSMMARAHPAAAITGTFFCTRSLIPTGDIAMYGTVVHTGCIGSALCIDTNNNASIVPLAEGRKNKWLGYETVMCAGPTLISNGRVSIDLKREGFSRGLATPTQRTAVGITKAGKLVIVAVNRKASFGAVARLMLKLGTKDALSLDGGSSTALYYQGRFFARPLRKLTNCLVAYSTTEKYTQAKAALAPAKLFSRPQKVVAAKPAITEPDIFEMVLLSPHIQAPQSTPPQQIYAASR